MAGPERNNKYSFRSGKALLSDGTEINIFDYFYEWFNNGILINDTMPVETLEQDNTSPPIVFSMNRVLFETTLAEDAAIDDDRVIVTDATGIQIGDIVVFINVAGNRYGFATVLNISGTLLILDTPLDFDFMAGDGCTARTIDMNIDGSAAPVTFSVRGDITIDIPVRIDISRILITVFCSNPPTLATFGDLAALAKGIVLRRRNGYYNNIVNLKSNGDIAGIAFDFDTYLATNPAQGQNGFTCRLTFNGQNKMGVVIRLGPGEDLECIIQDDLSSLERFRIVVEGHVAVV